MDDSQADKVLESMIQFIANHGEEQSKEIRRQTDQEYTIGNDLQ
jgi:vacuolar-type H+-ATPase subunit E/Vma4